MGKQFREILLGYNLAIKFGIMLTCPIIGCLFSGIYLDKRFGTTPWLMFILLAIGFVYAMYSIYRVAVRMHSPTSQTSEENNI